MEKLYIETPLIESLPLSKHLGVPVYLKMEAMQPSGSFKNRGIGHICSNYAKKGARQLICSSGGNAGLAVAYSGRKLGVPVKVIVPETTSLLMIRKIELEGAEVVVKGKVWDEADMYARSLVDGADSVYIHPFDHPMIWEGHSTMIEEVFRSGVRPGAVVVAIGGGGLFCGVLEGLHKVGWDDIPVITVETEGAASFAASLKAGKVVKLKEIKTIATSLGAKEIAHAAFEWTKKHQVYSEIVTDRAAVEAVLKFADDHRVLVEPACGAALSVVYNQSALLHRIRSILVIVCGGSGVSRAMISDWEKQVFP